VCYNRCHGNTVTGFWALWDNIYEYVCVITVAMVMLLRDFGPHGTVFMIVCLLLDNIYVFTALDVPIIHDG
jgi:hypothetical protein